MQCISASLTRRAAQGGRRASSTTQARPQRRCAPLAAQDAAGDVSRRSISTVLPAALAASVVPSLLATPPSAQAAYGQSANVFKKSKETTQGDYKEYTTDAYSILIPQRGFNPMPESTLGEWPGMEFKWEDFDATDYANVTVTVMEGSSLPKPEDLKFMLGQSTWEGFGEYSTVNYADKGSSDLSAGNVLDAKVLNQDGTDYAIYELLTRTVDGSQGGRHHLMSCAVKGGKVYIAKFTCGDKHWAHNQTIAYKTRDSFRVA